MFDARSLLEQLVRGGGQPQQGQNAPQGGMPGGLGDILGQLGQAFGQQGQPSSGGQAGTQSGGMPGGLGDILGRLGEAMGQPGGQPQARQIAPGEPQGGASRGGEQGGGFGGLEDILKNMLPGAGQGGAQSQAGAQTGGGAGQSAGGGGLMDILGQVLGQATQGVREGAGRVDNATGASGHLRDMLQKATGKNPDELLGQLKEMIEQNKLATGAAAGGLGAVILGTRAGRSLLGGAAKLGALALIGGLAYKALQNYQQGKPLVTGRDAGPGQQALLEAPQGSGFESNAVTNDAAIVYIRGMIAAAAADGRIDAEEQQKLIGSLTQAGLDAQAEEFLANELNNPASVDDLVRSVQSEAEAVQLFTAARIAVDLDTAEEHDFLVALAQGLGLDGELVAHIDAEARAAA